jgi:CubicO group peptidase (beta-lactamase class C family)
MSLPPRVRHALEDAIGAVTPGAAAALARPGGVEAVTALGCRREQGPPVEPDTRFDLASLTKVIATLPSVLRLVEHGEVGLDDRIGRYFSNAGWFQTPSLADATVRHLLAHSSGLPAWRPLFAQVSNRRTALAAVLQSPLEAPGEVRYSDLGFMLLGALVERVSGQRLDTFVAEHVHRPLGMHATGFGPLGGVAAAATEDCGWRGRLLEGEVHDENATVWDGVAGHAGLFGTAADVAAYASAWLRSDPLLGGEALLAEARTLQAQDDAGTRRGLGWVLAHPQAFTAARGFGHTGFTGTSMWIDPDGGLASVLLTNRVHPHRERGQAIVGLRRAFHDAAHGVVA